MLLSPQAVRGWWATPLPRRPLCVPWLLLLSLLVRLHQSDGQSANKNLVALLLQKQQAVSSLAAAVADNNAALCSSLQTCTASDLMCASVPAAAGLWTCQQTVLVDGTPCGTASCSTRLLDYTGSNVRLPPDIAVTSSGSIANTPSLLDISASVCSQTPLDATFRSLSPVNASNLFSGWLYFGSAQGAFREFPRQTVAQQQLSGTNNFVCGSYDPRLRPWYVSAASPPKALVVVMDIGAAMLNRASYTYSYTKQQAATTAATALIRNTVGSANSHDYVGVITYNTQAQPLKSSQQGMIQVGEGQNDTHPEFQAIFQELAAINISSTESSNLIAGLTAGFQMLNKTRTVSINCQQQVLVALIDPEPLKSADKIALISAINALKNSMTEPTSLFLYSVGAQPGANGASIGSSLLLNVACAVGAVYGNVDDRDNPLWQLRGYSNYMARLVNMTGTEWSAPYDDASGLGPVVTATRPVYDTSSNFIGVVGYDVSVKVLLDSLGLTSNQANTVEEALATLSRGCGKASLDACEVQAIQASSGYACPAASITPTCTSVPTTSSGTCNSTTQATLQPFLSVQPLRSLAAQYCCGACGASDDSTGSNVALIVGLTVGIAGGVLLIVTLGIAAYMEVRRRGAIAAEARLAAQRAFQKEVGASL